MKHILGVDIAKDKLDCCLLSPAGQKLNLQCANSPRSFAGLLKKLGAAGATAAELHACMEATGLYGEKLLHWLHARGVAVSKINPARVKYFAMSRLARNKTDRADAFLIAEFGRTQSPRLWTPPAPEVARLQGLNRLLHVRKEQLASERRRAAMLPDFLEPHLGALISALEGQIEKLQAQIDQTVARSAELKAKMELLCSIPCVGRVTAQTVLAELPAEIASARQAAAYAGVTPRQNESGQRQGRARLSKTGNTQLRRALYMPAVSGRTSNGRMKNLAARLREKGKSTMSIIGACMHLLMRLCYGVLASGKPYRADGPGRSQPA